MRQDTSHQWCIEFPTLGGELVRVTRVDADPILRPEEAIHIEMVEASGHPFMGPEFPRTAVSPFVANVIRLLLGGPGLSRDESPYRQPYLETPIGGGEHGWATYVKADGGLRTEDAIRLQIREVSGRLRQGPEVPLRILPEVIAGIIMLLG